MFAKDTKYGALVVTCGLSLIGASSAALATERTCYGKVTAPSIAGYYSDNFGGYQLVGKSIWISGGSQGELLFHYCAVMEAEKHIVTQNDATHGWNPNEYSRFEWTKSGTDLWYCQQVFSAKTEREAADFTAHPKADTRDPGTKGCGKNGKFPWTKMTPKD
ncbi:MAG: hypothetical protein DRR19_14750 [Candidatus Parabeggiatoa sp. nov. 1]|nr:MAG: hypothetical protein DRR19_14750 [Gammaproteobacteria bacterium]